MPRKAAAEEFVSDRLILPSGPPDAEGMLVGEAGGETEHWNRRPFAGKSGQVMSAYLLSARVPRGDLRILNVYNFWTGPGNPDPTPAQIAREEWRLIEEIERCKPRVIGAVGRVATRWFLGDVDLSTCHGLPYPSKRAPGAVIVPVHHPAAGFYNPDLAAFAQDDIFQFAYYLKNPAPTITPPPIKVVQVKPKPGESIIIEDAAVDTEGLRDRPWGLSWSVNGKTTYVYVLDGTDRKIVLRGRIIFQNALHDLVVLRAIGVDTSDLDYDDTMVKLYNLRLEPQGLKPAAFRHLGLVMDDFDDVVRPHFNEAALSFLREAATHKYPKPRPIPVEDYSKRKWRLYKPWDAGRRIKSALTSWDKKAESDDPVKLEKKWEDLGEEYQIQAEMKLRRPFPDFSIFNVPTEKAVRYSGIDAAATKLLDQKLQPLLKAKKLETVYEMDRQYLPFVDKMQETGMRVDPKKLHELEQHLASIRDRSRREVQKIVGDRWFNPGSDDQVGRWLYKVRGLPIRKWTEGGEGSTSAVTMKMIQGYHKEDLEVVAFTKAIREYRESDKYLGTFVLPIFDYMRRDRHGWWRIHPNFRVTRVVSGRNCLVPGTMVEVVRDVSAHPKGIPVEQVKPGDLVYSFDSKKRLCLRRVLWAGKTGTKRRIVRVHWRGTGGHSRGFVDCTPDHKFRLSSGEYKAASDLSYGDSILAMSRSSSMRYSRLHATGHKEIQDHRFVYRQVFGGNPQHVHHENENRKDNRPENLRGLRAGDHARHRISRFTAEQRRRQGAAAKRDWAADREMMIRRLKLRGKENVNWLGLTKRWMIDVLRKHNGRPTVFRDIYGIDYETAKKYIERHGIKWWLYRPDKRKVGGNHFITKVESLISTSDVYDIEVEDTHNFIANELCVHNSSHDPNVMAFPTRTALGAMIRACFVAAPGFVIVSVDASQIELRTMAHHCRDERMRYAFENGEDLHALTASLIFKVALESFKTAVGETAKLRKIQRYVAKTINFAVMYGISPNALLEQMFKADIFDFELGDCEMFIREWFRIYSSVQSFLKRVWHEAERDGFVRDMWGRMAYVPNLRVGDDRMRESARRLAGNMPIQGGARGLVKRAQIRVHQYLLEGGHYEDESVKPWLDLHDELDMEVRQDLASKISRMTVKMFTADQSIFRVPLVAEAGIGQSWAEAK